MIKSTDKILLAILQTLEEMKQQEKDYWETWKRTKLKCELGDNKE